MRFSLGTGRLGTKLQWWFACTAVALAASLPYASTVHGYFLADDFGLIQLLSHKPPWHFLSLFATSWTENIWGFVLDELRPFVAVSYQVNYAIGGVSPEVYHITNMTLHAMSSLLVLCVGRAACRLGLVASAFAGVLFALLPLHVETVVWITGRSDLIMVIFYLATLLLYVGWRARADRRLYLCSIVAFACALYNKQIAMVLPFTLVMYDLLFFSLWKRVRQSWRSVLPCYTPYALITVLFLLLRHVLFGSIARENQLGWYIFTNLASYDWRSVESMFRGWEPWLVLLLPLAAYSVFRLKEGLGPLNLRLVLYFGPAWWLVSTAPIALAYFSVRHFYLAAVGIALLFAIVLESFWRARSRYWRIGASAAAVGIVLASLIRLQAPIAQWYEAGVASERIMRDARLEAEIAKPGSLLLLGAPYRGADPATFTRIWEFALPFALQPPFMPPDVANNVVVIAPSNLYCCPSPQWYAETTGIIREWADRSDWAEVTAVAWNADGDQFVRRSGLEDSALGVDAASLEEAKTPAELSARLAKILNSLR